MYGCMDVWMYGRMDVWMYGCMHVCMYGMYVWHAWMHACMYGMHGMRCMHGIHDMVWCGMAWHGMYVQYVAFQTFSVKNHFFERLDSNAMKNARKNAPRKSKHELGSNNVNMERPWFQQQMI